MVAKLAPSESGGPSDCMVELGHTRLCNDWRVQCLNLHLLAFCLLLWLALASVRIAFVAACSELTMWPRLAGLARTVDEFVTGYCAELIPPQAASECPLEHRTKVSP